MRTSQEYVDFHILKPCAQASGVLCDALMQVPPLPPEEGHRNRRPVGPDPLLQEGAQAGAGCGPREADGGCAEGPG